MTAAIIFEGEFEIAGVGVNGGLIVTSSDDRSRISNFLFLNDLRPLERAKFDALHKTNSPIKITITGKINAKN
jgi:hypothetical protein